MVQPTIKKLTAGREKIKGLDPKKEYKTRAQAQKKFPNTTETSKRIGNQAIHKKTGASLTSPNANDLNTRRTKAEHSIAKKSTGRPDTLSARIQGKRSISQGPGKRRGTGRGTISQTQPSQADDPRVQRTQRNMKDMNRAFKKDVAPKVKTRASVKQVAKSASQGLSKKPLTNTLGKYPDNIVSDVRKAAKGSTTLDRHIPRKALVGAAKQHVKRQAAGRLLSAVPYVGTAINSSMLGYAAGKGAKAVTTKKVSGTSMASVNPRGMHASQVKSAADKLKKRK